MGETCKKIVFTGKIDEFYNYKLGKLEYRTVHFEEKIYDIANYQGNAVINYTEKIFHILVLLNTNILKCLVRILTNAQKRSYQKNTVWNGWRGWILTIR